MAKIWPEGDSDSSGYQHSIKKVGPGEAIYANSWGTSRSIKTTRDGTYVDYKPFEVEGVGNGNLWLVRIPVITERPIYLIDDQDIQLYRFEVEVLETPLVGFHWIHCSMGSPYKEEFERLRGEPTYNLPGVMEPTIVGLRFRYWIPPKKQQGHEVPFKIDDLDSDIEFYLSS